MLLTSVHCQESNQSHAWHPPRLCALTFGSFPGGFLLGDGDHHLETLLFVGTL